MTKWIEGREGEEVERRELQNVGQGSFGRNLNGRKQQHLCVTADANGSVHTFSLSTLL